MSLAVLCLPACLPTNVPGAALTNCIAECGGNQVCERDCRDEFTPEQGGPMRFVPTTPPSR